MCKTDPRTRICKSVAVLIPSSEQTAVFFFFRFFKLRSEINELLIILTLKFRKQLTKHDFTEMTEIGNYYVR